ncbi:MAG: glycosyltransferase family 4 protein [Acidimicrobiales bacterium]
MSGLRVGVNLLYLKPGRVGGTEDYVRRLLGALDTEAADEVELTLFVNRRFPAAYPELAAAHETIVAPTSGDHPPARIALEATWLARASARRRLDLVHHPANTIPHVVTRPAVVSIHDLQPIVRPQDFGRVKSAYLKRRLGPSARKARLVATLSDYVRRLVIDRFDLEPDRVMVVPGPIDLPKDVPPDNPANAGAPLFVYPAITHPHKNHVMLIRAFREVAQVNPEVSLVLTGGAGSDEPEVRREIARLRLEARIRRPGRIPRPDLDGLLRRATALTFPSRHEGYGLPVAEAMALGCPVIASDTTALPEVVGDAGLLVDPDDVDGWAAAMTRLLDDQNLRSRLAAAGRRRVAWLTPAETARRMVAAYRSALASG